MRPGLPSIKPANALGAPHPAAMGLLQPSDPSPANARAGCYFKTLTRTCICWRAQEATIQATCLGVSQGANVPSSQRCTPMLSHVPLCAFWPRPAGSEDP
eukprot:15464723-Alexandrium_andersonii.AAC.1